MNLEMFLIHIIIIKFTLNVSISAFCGCLLIANDDINIKRNIKEHNEIDKGVVRFSRLSK